MNLLAHLYLAERTQTSAAGQILGDMVKGRLDDRYNADIMQGIHLHRRIDSFTDQHPVTAQLRRQFAPPLRRYGGILVDIGFDHCLARRWHDYSNQPLPQFAAAVVARARQTWPHNGPMPAQHLAGLDQVIAAYDDPTGLQRALASVSNRLQRTNPLAQALPALLQRMPAIGAGFEAFFPALCAHVEQTAARNQ